MNNQFNLNNKRLIYSVTAVIALAFVAIVAWFSYEATASKITLNVAPEEMTMVIDEREPTVVKRGDTVKLQPGNYTLNFSQKGFKDKVIDLATTRGEDKTIVVALEPNSASASDYYSNDPDSKVIYEGSHSADMSAQQKAFEDANPKFAQLPFNYREYSAYICPSLKYPNDNLKRSVCVDLAVPEARDLAVQSMEKQGFSFMSDEIYVSSNPKVRQIITNSDYRVEYSHDITASKPVFLINVANASGSIDDRHNQIMRDLESAGYDKSKFMIAYANSQFSKYNSDRYITYPDSLR